MLETYETTIELEVLNRHGDYAIIPVDVECEFEEDSCGYLVSTPCIVGRGKGVRKIEEEFTKWHDYIKTQILEREVYNEI